MQGLAYFLHRLDRCSTVASSGIWLYVRQAIAHRRRAARKSSSPAGKGIEPNFVFTMTGSVGTRASKEKKFFCEWRSLGRFALRRRGQWEGYSSERAERWAGDVRG